MTNQAKLSWAPDKEWASIKCVHCPREIRGYYQPILRLFEDMKEDGWILEDNGESQQINAMCPECSQSDARAWIT